MFEILINSFNLNNIELLVQKRHEELEEMGAIRRLENDWSVLHPLSVLNGIGLNSTNTPFQNFCLMATKASFHLSITPPPKHWKINSAVLNWKSLQMEPRWKFTNQVLNGVFLKTINAEKFYRDFVILGDLAILFVSHISLKKAAKTMSTSVRCHKKMKRQRFML